MPAHVTLHSDSADGAKTIALQQTGPATGTVRLLAPGHDQDYALKAIGADRATLTLACKLDAFFSADITVAVRRSASGGGPVARVTIAHAFLGNGTVDYPLRAGEDTLMDAFLAQAGFPPLA